MRYSSRREAILRMLKNTKEHPSAETVYNKVRETIPNISLGTVYRNLKDMTESGELETVETKDGSLHYDADISSHAHFVCETCGKISDIFGYDDIREPLEHAGYKVTGVKTVVYGICPDCLKSKSKYDGNLS